MNGERLIAPIRSDEPLTIVDIDGPYHENKSLRQLILNRGI